MTELERLIGMLSCGNTTPQERIRWARSIVDLAHAEGVAEGAEKERVEIVRGSQRFHQHDDVADSDYISTHYGTEIDTVVADCDLFVIPRSVLAPTKDEP